MTWNGSNGDTQWWLQGDLGRVTPKKVEEIDKIQFIHGKSWGSYNLQRKSLVRNKNKIYNYNWFKIMTLSYRKHRVIISAHLRKRSGWWARWQGRHQLKLEESLANNIWVSPEIHRSTRYTWNCNVHVENREMMIDHLMLHFFGTFIFERAHPCKLRIQILLLKCGYEGTLLIGNSLCNHTST
jgi:hypothetical protein